MQRNWKASAGTGLLSALMALPLVGLPLLAAPTAAAVDAPDAVVHRLAGGSNGDGGPAPAAQLAAVSVDRLPDGDLVVLEEGASDGTVRRVDAGTGTITTLISGLPYLGNYGHVRADAVGHVFVGTPHTLLRFRDDGASDNWSMPADAIDDWDVEADGTLLLATHNQFVAQPLTGPAQVLAGVAHQTGTSSPDGTPAASAYFWGLRDPMRLADGRLAFVEARRLRVIDHGVVRTLAGTLSGDDTAPAVADGAPPLSGPLDSRPLVAGPGGTFLVDGTAAGALRRIDPATTVTTVQPAGTLGSCPRNDIQLDGDAVLSACGQVRRVPLDGSPATVLAGRTTDDSPDGVLARQGSFGVTDAATGPGGLQYLLSPTAIRRVEPDGTVTTVAGGGSAPGGLVSGVPGRQALLSTRGSAVGGPEGVTFADANYASGPLGPTLVWRLRRLLPDGTVVTVAGGGTRRGAQTTAVPALELSLGDVDALVRTGDGSLVAAVASDTGHQLLRIDPTGQATTIAGSGTLSRPEGPALAANLAGQICLADDPTHGRLLLGSGASLVALTNGRLSVLMETGAGCPLAVLPDGGVTVGAFLLRPDGAFGLLGTRSGATVDGAALGSTPINPWRSHLASDGALLFVDAAGALWRIDGTPRITVPAPAVSTVTAASAALQVTARVTEPLRQVVVRIRPGTVAPGNVQEGSEVWSGTLGSSTAPLSLTVRDFPRAGGGAPEIVRGGQPYAVSVFTGSVDSDSWSGPTSTVVTPPADTQPPAPVVGLATTTTTRWARLNWQAAQAGDDRDHVVVRASATHAPVGVNDGELTPSDNSDPLIRYVTRPSIYAPLYVAVFAVDPSGNVSAPARVTVPAAVLDQTRPGPATSFTWQTVDMPGQVPSPGKRIDITYQPVGTDVRFAVGDVPPRAPTEGTPAWTNGLGVSYAQSMGGLTVGQHLSVAMFTPSTDGSTYSRLAKVIVVGTSSSTPIGAFYAARRPTDLDLGTPVTAEYAAGVGRAQNYTKARLYSSPKTAAHEVHGAILGVYLAKGGPTAYLGFPISDERTTPDGVGRANHFTGGSVYWSPRTGAHEVRGAIRTKWIALGAERSRLGYPTSDEYAVTGGRRSSFAGGTITWIARTGALQVVYR